MKRKLSYKFLAVIILLLAIIIAGVIYYQKKGEIKNINNKGDDSYFNYIIANKEGPIVACIIGEEKENNFCFNNIEKTFTGVNFLKDFSTEKNLAGFYILTLNDGIWEEYPVDKDELLNRWYNELLANEKQFLIDVDNKTDVDLYNLVKIRRLQILRKEITEEEFIKELNQYSKDPYKILTPMNYSDLLYICTLISSESCDAWGVHQKRPYELIKATNLDARFEYTEMRSLYSRIKFLIMGYNSINMLDENNKQKINEYDKFLKKVISENPQLSKEKIFFIGNYLPLDLIDSTDSLFNNWGGKFSPNYLWLLGAVCKDKQCLDNKLNILYDEYIK